MSVSLKAKSTLKKIRKFIMLFNFTHFFFFSFFSHTLYICILLSSLHVCNFHLLNCVAVEAYKSMVSTFINL